MPNPPVCTQRLYRTIWAFYDRERALAHGTEEDRRTLTTHIAQQMCFDEGPQWGVKAQSASHPQSKDVIALLQDGTLWGWDWQSGSTRWPQVSVRQPAMDLTGQFFMAVAAVNHLPQPVVDQPPQPPAPPVTPQPPASDPGTRLEILLLTYAAEIEKLRDQVFLVHEAVKRVEAKQNPAYSGRVLGWSLTLDPRQK